MATLSRSASCPEGAHTFSLGQITFSLDDNGKYETDDATVIANARDYAWLDVDDEAPAEHAPEPVAVDTAVIDPEPPAPAVTSTVVGS